MMPGIGSLAAGWSDPQTRQAEWNLERTRDRVAGLQIDEINRGAWRGWCFRRRDGCGKCRDDDKSGGKAYAKIGPHTVASFHHARYARGQGLRRPAFGFM